MSLHVEEAAIDQINKCMSQARAVVDLITVATQRDTSMPLESATMPAATWLLAELLGQIDGLIGRTV